MLKHHPVADTAAVTAPRVTRGELRRLTAAMGVQQRGSEGCWRTIEGLAEFALVQSYLSTAAKWGISKLDALRGLFNGHTWLPPGLEPAA
jgi:transposase